MRDLNKLIRPGSGLQITNAFNINDRGEILAKSFPIGTTPNDDADLGHLVLLIPCDKDDHDGDCRTMTAPMPPWRRQILRPSPPPSHPAHSLSILRQHQVSPPRGGKGWRATFRVRLGANEFIVNER